ncbi:MAG: DUF1318 domain-containing protein [bacterium]
MKTKPLILLFALTFFSACVTINVYFPAAEAESAAGEFIEDVIGVPDQDKQEQKDQQDVSRPLSANFSLFNLLIPSAHAAANLDIKTPAVKAIQSRMKQRYEKNLKDLFDKGNIGMGQTGLVEIHSTAGLNLKQKKDLKVQLGSENNDRNAVYREIAVANGHPEWEADIRTAFAKQWISLAHKGWYFRDANGQWQQK